MDDLLLHISVMLPVGALIRGNSGVAGELRITGHLLLRSLAVA
jgi:hypothetical protein